MKRALEVEVVAVEGEVIDRYMFRRLTGLVGSFWGAGPFLPMI